MNTNDQNLYPVQLEKGEDELLIVWSDQSNQRISYKRLRKSCPCAGCATESESQDQEPSNPLTVLPLEKTQPLKIESMRPVGNYAYSIAFTDGHSSGIFTFQLLRSLENISP